MTNSERPAESVGQPYQHMSEPELSVGDYVKVADHLATRTTKGITFRVVEIAATGRNRVKMDPLSGASRGVRADAWMLEKVQAPAASVESIPIPEPLPVGAVVTISGRGWKEPVGDLYVVVKVELSGHSKVYPLGGDARGRYWNKIPRDYVTIIDPKTVKVVS